MIPSYVYIIYDGYADARPDVMLYGLEEAMKTMSREEVDFIKSSPNKLETARRHIYKKYENEIQEKMDWFENNLTEENEWDYLSFIHLKDFYSKEAL